MMRTTAPTLAAACAALGLLVPAPARAQPEPVRPGTQPSPPRVKTAQPPPLDPKEGGRRAVRGCPIDGDCHSELEAGMRQFELEAFPKEDSRSPWVERHDAHGHSGVRYFGSGRSPLPRAIGGRSG